MSASYGRLRVRARLGHTKDHYKKIPDRFSACHACIRVPVQPEDLKGWVVCGTFCEDMHLKDLESIKRVGCCIPVLDFYLVLHALRCQKCTIMDYYPYRAFGGQNKIVYSTRFVRRAIFF